MLIAWRYAATASSSFLFLQRIAKVGMSLGKVRFDADRLAICGDRLIELAMTIEHIAEIGKVTRCPLRCIA